MAAVHKKHLRKILLAFLALSIIFLSYQLVTDQEQGSIKTLVATSDYSLAEEEALKSGAPVSSDEGSAAGKLERSLILRGNFQVEVEEPQQGADELQKWLKTQDAFVDEVFVTHASYDKKGYLLSDASAILTVRMKDSSKLKDYLQAQGKLLQEELIKTDVTAQVVDIDARIASLETSVKRLTAFLSEAKSYQDVFQIESELTRRQGELDSLRGQQKALKEQVDFNSITVEFVTSSTAKNLKADSEKSFKDGLLTGWNSLVSFFTAVGFTLAVMASWLIVLVPLGLIFLFYSRRRKGKKNTPKE